LINNFYIALSIYVMRKDLKLLLILGLFFPHSILAQADEDIFEANRLKKVFPDDRVAATSVEEVYNFDKGRSAEKLPVVPATKYTGIPLLTLP